MRKGGSNAKGGGFERLVCRALTKWITGEEKPEIFWRSATSGAKATQDAKAGHKSKMGGDIVAIDEQGQWFTDHFRIECKNRADYGNLDQLILGRGEFLKWWDQACTDADRANKEPFLIFKRTRGHVFVALWNGSGIDLAYPYLLCVPLKKSHQIVICRFDHWLAENHPDDLNG